MNGRGGGEPVNEYIAIFRMKLIEGLQYRAAALAGIATQFFFGFMYILIYHAFYAGSAGEQPMGFGDLASYLWLRQAFLALYMMWWQDNELLESITSGYVAYEFCRPYSLYEFWFARLAAVRISGVLLRCFPILIVTSLLPSPWRMNPPGGAAALGLFLVSLSLSLLLAVAISMFVYISTFLTLNAQGSRLLVSLCAEFFSGALIPVPFMPAPVRAFVRALPFAYTADVPFRIYSGDIPPREALTGIGIQLVWIVLLWLAGRWCFGRIQRRVVIQGG